MAKVNVLNKSKRKYYLSNGVVSEPGKVVELDSKEAEVLVKGRANELEILQVSKGKEKEVEVK